MCGGLEHWVEGADKMWSALNIEHRTVDIFYAEDVSHATYHSEWGSSQLGVNPSAWRTLWRGKLTSQLSSELLPEGLF